MNGTLLESEKRSATAASVDVVSTAGQRGVLVTLDVTGAPDTEDTLTLSIEARDPASGKYVPLTGFAAVKGNAVQEDGTLAFTLHPGASETAVVAGHEVQSLGLPRKWRVVVTHSEPGEGEEAAEWTYSVGVSPIA